MAHTVIKRLGALSPYAQNILGPGNREADPPIRSELFGAQRFEQHGRSLARAQVIRASAERGQGPPFFPRLQENISALRQAYDYVALTSRSGHYVTPAAEWLLDNFHLVEAQLQQIHDGVPRLYYAHLPKLAGKPLDGLPRVYGIAWAYVAHTDSVLDPVLFTAFLDAYQDVNELNLGELWALPTTLRVVLLENLRRVADRIAQSKVARELAHAVWDNPTPLSESSLDELLALMQQRGLERNYLTQLWQRLPAERPASTAPLVHWIEKHCPDGLALIAESQTAQVTANLTISNIITSLRLIGQVEWIDLIEPVSRSLRVLRQLPNFSRESEGTRQQITQAMEKVARDRKRPELEVAQAVVEAALACPESSAGRTSAYHLIGPGRQALESSLTPARQGQEGRTAPSGLPPRTSWRLAAYLCALLAGTLALVFFSVRGLPLLAWPVWVAMALMLFPASEAVASLIHRLIAESARVKSLPRLDFASGIPAEHRALVVIPCMLSSGHAVRELAHQLRLHWLANREANAQFALLADWSDAMQASEPDDDALLRDATAHIAALNEDYPVPDGTPPRFVLLHRPRTWCSTEQRWMGWERKRGKLEMLVRGIARGHDFGESPAGHTPGHQASPVGTLRALGGTRLASGIRYIVTLDSDTGLPPSALRELVSIAAHPLNAPHVDTQTRRVVAGYGILQPRVVTPLPPHEHRSPFHAMFAGQCGIDPYSSGTSDLYQDMFALGTFTGKGLLNVQAVYATLDERFPNDAILSHDLLEGTIARCGYVSDVVLAEDHPHHAGVDASRIHRWTRGDWQLLPLLMQAGRYGIDSLGAWKMLDNLRRSLVAPASLALLVWVIFTAAMPLSHAIGAVLAAYLLGPLLGALAGLLPTRSGIALRHFFHLGMIEVARAFASTAWLFTQLVLRAGLQANAVVLSVWRMAVSRKNLLQWTTAAQAQAAARYSAWAFLKKHLLATALCIALALLAQQGPYPLAGALLFAVWALGPLTAWWVSRPAPPFKNLQASAKDSAYLEPLARQTWTFFEHCVTAADNHLPPDNLQLDPEPMLAHRTSPTNIGLYLLSVACAREFGWISTAMMIKRLQLTLETVERMEKHQGHLLNWYQTETLAVLQPAYVSTVDSGNFAGHLLAVAEACRSQENMADTTPGEKRALHELRERCAALCMAMDFRGLYNPKRHLFHIGLRVNEQILDPSYYDLLASESRLTSFLAIAKGDVPRRHWMALGRAFLSVGVTPGLKSWSGSMFEYLMPSLVMHEPEQGLLHQSGIAAVHEQQAFGREQGMPWGVSESAYFAQDHSLAYQYSPFGVPRLALRRTPANEHVVAPYASALATMFEPADAIANLRRLEALGARGEYGFMDALDFTASRQAHAERFSIVRNYMAHHQGMALVALCNVLRRQAPRRWFSQAPLVEAYATLLHERTPRQIIRSADPRALPAPDKEELASLFQSRTISPTAPQWQPTQLLSNGRYSIALRANGAGVSRWGKHNITRWRDDLLRDQYGSFLYLREDGSERLNSLTSHPAPHPRWNYSARFMADRVQFDMRSPVLETTITVLVSPEDDTELRSVVLHNTSSEDIVYEVISCFEAVLAPPRADEAHPAFSNLFLETMWRPEWKAVLLSRRPRLHGDAVLSVAHFLAAAEADILSVDCIADRRSFLGRNRERSQPALLEQERLADGSPVNGLDPIACLRVKVRIAAGATARLTFATAAAEDAAELVARIDKYMQAMHVERATRMAATLAQVRLRDLGLSPEENAALQDMTTALMYNGPRAPSGTGPVDQRQLWRFGISGDKPIVLVRIHSSAGLALLQSLLHAQPWWSFGGLATDVVVLNSEANSYLMPLQRDILALRDRLIQQVQHSFPRSDTADFYLLRDHEVSPGEKAALTGLANVVITADGRPLETQVSALHLVWAPVRPGAVQSVAVSPTALPDAGAQPLRTPAGRFDAASGEFRFDIDAVHRTPRPWVNVIANENFGFQVSEAGSGYTWAVNSRLHQLTPWSNDPVQDPPSEHYLLQDLETFTFLNLTPGSDHSSSVRHRVRHGQGYSVFECLHGSLHIETTFFAAQDDAVKLVHVQLRNDGIARRRLRAVAMAEWQMGQNLGERRTVHSWKPDALDAMLASQREGRAGFGGATTFFGLAGASTGREPLQWTGDRGEFFGPAGELVVPDALGQRGGGGLDACSAVSGNVYLEPGGSASFTFLLGHAADSVKAEQLAARWLQADVPAALQAVKDFWDELLGKVQVKTPDPLFDALVNRWLLYQTLTSRLWSKAGFYQAGGAFGFRDQLQDSMAFATADPARLRRQILLNASRQFPEGDVQHWWHAPGGEGVRTHFSDDLLWLPYACAHYVHVTGDTSVLQEEVAFIDGAQIPDGAEDAYYAPDISAVKATVYGHCARTIDRSLPTGVHGLPLMGTGDWNDGMNRVGHEGKGESVWLAWFACTVVQDFLPLAESRGDTGRVQRWKQAREGWIAALHSHGWDGQWFRRAFFDNGHPLGSSANAECRIDLIAQAWSVLSGASTEKFTRPAMQAMNEQLIDHDAGLLRLLTPALQHSADNPGYIQAYPRGVRENGGQYSHAAVWALMAQAQTGDREGAWESFQALSPAHRSQHPARAAAYELEPYVMAGDIYGDAPYVGRGGWSWYTGSAAWLHRASLETLLGLRVRQGELSLSPCVPAHWPAFELRLQLGAAGSTTAHTVTIRWQQPGTEPDPAFPPHRVLSAGDSVHLAALPPDARLLVL